MNFLHKHKTVISFMCLSLIIVIFFSLFHWFNIKNHKEKLPYLPHPDWSQPKEIIPNLYSKSFSAIPEKNCFTLFWLQKNYNVSKEKLFVQQNNYRGKLLKKNTIITDYALNSFSVKKIKNKYHLLYLSGKSEESQLLQYMVLSNNFSVLEERIIKRNLSYAGNLQSDYYENNLYFTYTNTFNKTEHIKLGSIDITKNDINFITIKNYDKHSVYPNIIVNNKGINLSWLQQKNIFTSASKSSINRYELYYNNFTHNLEPVYQPVYIGKAYAKNSDDTPVIKTIDNNVFILWNIYNHQNKQKHLYYTLFDPCYVRDITANKLIPDPGQYPNVIINNNLQIVYSGHTLDSLLKIISTEELNNNLNSNVLFPGYKLSYNPQIFKDNKNNLNLLWIKLDNNKRKLYYAGTQNPKTQGFFQTLGLKPKLKDLSLITTILYFVTFPLLPLFNNFIFCLAAAGSILLLYWLGNKISFLNFLTRLNNSYTSYLLILSFVFIFITFKDVSNFLFYPDSPPANAIIPLFTTVSLSGLIFLKINNSNNGKGLPILWGAGTSIIWFYWVAQANLIFHAYKFFY